MTYYSNNLVEFLFSKQFNRHVFNLIQALTMPNNNIHKPKRNCANTYLIARTPKYSLIISMKNRMLSSYISKRKPKSQAFFHRNMADTSTSLSLTILIYQSSNYNTNRTRLCKRDPCFLRYPPI